MTKVRKSSPVHHILSCNWGQSQKGLVMWCSLSETTWTPIDKEENERADHMPINTGKGFILSVWHWRVEVAFNNNLNWTATFPCCVIKNSLRVELMSCGAVAQLTLNKCHSIERLHWQGNSCTFGHTKSHSEKKERSLNSSFNMGRTQLKWLTGRSRLIWSLSYNMFCSKDRFVTN